MIRMILRIDWLRLSRDRVALGLTFVLPVAFFTIFAFVFGGMDQPEARRIDLLLVLEETTPTTQRFRQIVSAHPGVRLIESGEVVDREEAMQRVREGSADAVVIVPQGFSQSFAEFGSKLPTVWTCANEAHPLASPLVEGVIQSTAMMLVLELKAPQWRSINPKESPAGLVQVQSESALGAQGKKPSIAYFAAGIGVLFLLFTVSGRSAILIEERETGVLDRLLSSRLTLTQLLLGRWLFLVALGCVQVTLMFVWASLVFGLEFWTLKHLCGFSSITLATAGAAAALGVLLAVSCRSRAQLNGISAVLILLMSALGGSMFPRFLMPEHMRALGRFTFNSWALDGYQKVFWYEVPPLGLWPEVLLLSAMSITFLWLAQQIARRSIAPG